MKIQNFVDKLNNDEFDAVLKKLYGTKAVEVQTQRYKNAIDNFTKLYPSRDDIKIFSAPGRTEIGGNHTDHQHGCVLAAAVNLDVIAVVSFHNDGVIRLKSEGYDKLEIDLSDLSVNPEEKGTSASIIRGIAAKFADMGVETDGFDAYATSDVLSGSGLSSSAAFENLIGTIIDVHYNNGKAGAVEIAKIGQYAENVYFGKGSGLMDQMVSSVGGFVFIDFYDTANPKIEAHNFNFEQAGYCICITDTKGSHADLTDDYVSVPVEMKSIAQHFDKNVLRKVDETQFYNSIPYLREQCGDRAVMRAAHFFGENQRAIDEAKALENGDVDKFFSLVRSSANSSANLLQNLYSCKKPDEQGIPLAIMMSKHILGEDAVVRVHGGGFAGTIQAFVPLEKAEEYSNEMNRIFGDGSCYILRIRPVGGIEITSEE
jgi:galactokinase